MVCETVISNWLAAFGEPDILVADKDKRCTGEVPQDFCTPRNITLQNVIPRHHQSIGATDRTHAHFRGIVDHVIGNSKSNFLPRKEWGEFSAMAALRLNSQALQYDGFTPGRRVSGGRQNCRLGRCVIPILRISRNQLPPATKSLSLLNTFFKYEKRLRGRILTVKCICVLKGG